AAAARGALPAALRGAAARRGRAGRGVAAQRHRPAVAGGGPRPGPRRGRGPARRGGRVRLRGGAAGPGRGLLRPDGGEGGAAVIRELCWKEYREQRWLWLAMVGMTALLLAGLVAVLEPGNREAPATAAILMASQSQRCSRYSFQ